MDKKVFIRSFGCQMNKLDTALVAAAIKQVGFNLTNNVKEADVILINTCSVRQHAEERVFSHLGYLAHIRKSRPNLIVGVIGCMAQRLGTQLLSHPAVDLVVGPAQIPQIPQLVKKTIEQNAKSLAVTGKYSLRSK